MTATSERIQRLIDGQLDPSGRRELLLHIERNEPARWRDLALGFVESQMLKESFSQKDAVQASVSDDATGLVATVEPVAANPTEEQKSSRIAAITLRVAALAACLVLGFLIGDGSPGTSSSDENASLPGAETRTGQPGTGLPRYGTLNVGDSNPGEFALPVWDATSSKQEIERALAQSARPLHRIKEELTREGQASSLGTTYITARLEGGKRLVIPVSWVAPDSGG